MSRIGKLPIEIGAKVTVNVDGNKVTVKGPLGELSRVIENKNITVKVDGATLVVNRANDESETKAAHGLYRQLIANMVKGVVTPFERTLILSGVGYKAAVQGTKLVLNIGYSHPVEFEFANGVKAEVKESDDKSIKLVVSGIDKEAVGQFAAKIRAARPVEPYHAYGVHYSDEVVIHKEGKTSGKK